MNRCSKLIDSLLPRRAAMAVGTAALLMLLPSLAAAQRMFPMGVERGSITFTAPPQVVLDGQAERLAPGARVLDTHNRIVLSGTVRGKTFAVNYFRDAAGVVRDIWLLTPAEADMPAKPKRVRATSQQPTTATDPTSYAN